MPDYRRNRVPRGTRSSHGEPARLRSDSLVTQIDALRAHMDYVHFNPVRHGLVEHPAEWPHSSFRRCVADGLYPAGWMRSPGEPPETGERR